MTARTRIAEAISWERKVIVISFYISLVAFVIVFVLGNLASAAGHANPVDLKTAGLWLVRAFGVFAVLGTLINVIRLLGSFFKSIIKRT